jgi:very-short-patch-repair endonuclease
MLQTFKKKLRQSQTDAEKVLWYYLRNRALDGFKFRRQHRLRNYIVDFVCLEKKLVIELDGGQHAAQEKYDGMREEILKAEGFRICRFWNNEIFENLEGVLETILKELRINKFPSPAAPSDLFLKGRGEI